MRPLALALALLFVGPVMAGCIDLSLDAAGTDALPSDGFDTSRGWSMPLSPALYDILPGLKEFVPSFDGTPISLGIHLPDITGCDWTASAFADACRLPVVMDSGPYFADAIHVEKYRPPLVEWLVPRGYAVVYMAVRGTGESGGCMEFMSMNEQRDVDHIVTWLAKRPWSNGNVGMMGRSYDGTTPFMAAAFGNPHLKTIVPISGVSSVPDLMYKNGTSETRGPIMHSYVYWANFGLGFADGGATAHRADKWAEQACEETVLGVALGPVATLTGDVSDDYWQVREFRPRIVENYQGSIWIIHGLEDWNVNPSQVVPWINELQDAGIETKAWLGVWGHAYPDRVDEHRNVRWDWAEQTVQWFDFYLKGEGEKPRLDVEVEDSLYVWRSEASYPPRDAEWLELVPPMSGSVGANGRFVWTSDVLEKEHRIAGLPQFHVTATPTTVTGGYLFAELYDIWPDGRSMRIGWGAIDLRHHAGGNTNPATLTPGTPVVAMMEFEPTDALVAEGHRLRVVLHKDGVQDIMQSPDPSVVLIGESVLRLPIVERSSSLPTYVPPGDPR